MCSRCSHLGHRNGKTFECTKCGHKDHADANAGFNIANRAYMCNDLDIALNRECDTKHDGSVHLKNSEERVFRGRGSSDSPDGASSVNSALGDGNKSRKFLP